MKKAICYTAGMLGFFTSASAASAADGQCVNFYINNVNYDAADVTGAKVKSALMAGLMAAVLPVGVGVSGSKANDSEEEIGVKKFLDGKGKENKYLVGKFTQINNLREIKGYCYTLISVERSVVKYMGGTATLYQILKFFTTEPIDKNNKIYQAEVSIVSPFPLKPTRRFEEDRTGKYVEVTKKPVDSTVQLENFYDSVRKVESSLAEKVLKKYSKK